MSAYYDLYETPSPNGDKEKKSLHARIYPKMTYNSEEFLKNAEVHQHLPHGILSGALQAITDELCYLLANGNIVEVGELGFFSTSLKCLKETTDDKQIRAESVVFQNVNLRLSSTFRKKIMEEMTLERIHSPARKSKRVKSTVEERKEKLLFFLDENVCITRKEYILLTGLADHAAIYELNNFITQNIVRRRGAGRTAVYVKAVRP